MATFTEMETDEKQRTMGNFGYNRYSSTATSTLDNQLDFSSTGNFTSPSPYTSTYTSPLEREEQEETHTYEVEKEYNFEKLPEDEIIVPTFMPTLDRPEPEVDTNANVKIRLNARGKIMASVFCMVVGLLIAFMIYNAVVIRNLSNTLDVLEVEKQAVTASVNELTTDYQGITSNRNLELEAYGAGFRPSPESSDVVLEMPTRPEIKSVQESGHWFDSLCEFLSNIFN